MTRIRKIQILRLWPLLFFAVPASALADGPEHSTVGVSGYDLVSYHTGEKPLRGNGNHLAVHDGVTYLFVNEENKEAFEANPQKYTPAYGGYCAYGVTVGKKFVGDPDVWEVVDVVAHVQGFQRGEASRPERGRRHHHQ